MLKEGHHNLIGKVVLLFYDFLHLKLARTEPPPTPMAIPNEIRNVIGKTTVTTAIVDRSIVQQI
jgi:hypothetical protein